MKELEELEKIREYTFKQLENDSVIKGIAKNKKMSVEEFATYFANRMINLYIDYLNGNVNKYLDEKREGKPHTLLLEDCAQDLDYFKRNYCVYYLEALKQELNDEKENIKYNYASINKESEWDACNIKEFGKKLHEFYESNLNEETAKELDKVNKKESE